MELTVAEISRRLAEQALVVCQKLLPGGRVHSGNEYLCGDITGGKGDSLKVCIFGQYVGQWRDWSNDVDHGDLLDLWRIVKGITAAEAIKEAKSFLGIVDPVRMSEQKSYSAPQRLNTAPLAEDGGAMRYLTLTRNLSASVVRSLKIEGDKERRAIVFPSYSPGGTLINRSYRTLGEKKKVWQDAGCAPSLFGWQALPRKAYDERKVLLSEGQIDCATWLVWGIPALSIPNGSGTTWVEYEWDNLACFDTIYLAFDQDEAGQKITEKVLARLGKHRCLIVSLPKKDANACLQAGYTAQEAAQWVADAKVPRIKRLVTTGELEERLVAEIQPKFEPFTLSFFKGNWPHSGFYFRPGEVTVWGGYAGAGKSTMLNFMQSALIAHCDRVFIASFEIKPEANLRKLATIHLGESLNEETARDYARLVNDRLVFADVVGSIEQDALLEMMWFSHRRYGCTHFIIDSLMRIEKLEEDYPAQGAFTNRLQEFSKETGAHVHLVAHLGKPSGGGERPSMYSVKGSSLIVNGADNVLLVARNPEKEKLRKAGKLGRDQEQGMHDTEIIVEKHRETGWLHTFKLRFNAFRYSYSTMNELVES
jgi:twinkle protein